MCHEILQTRYLSAGTEMAGAEKSVLDCLRAKYGFNPFSHDFLIPFNVGDILKQRKTSIQPQIQNKFLRTRTNNIDFSLCVKALDVICTRRKSEAPGAEMEQLPHVSELAEGIL